MKPGTKVGTIGTDLHSIRTKKTLQSKRKSRLDADNTSWHGRVSASEKQSMLKRGVIGGASFADAQLVPRMADATQLWLESRAARIEALRAQVEAGTYQVDSTALAESILLNQVSFLKD